jgi:hypothetical protein
VRAPDEWIPEVADVARRLYEIYGGAKPGTPDAVRMIAERIQRLGTDPPLANRWKLLPRDKVAKLFEAAGRMSIQTRTYNEIIDEMDRRNKVANELRRLARWAFPPHKAQAMLAVANDIEEEMRQWDSYSGPWVVKKNKLDPLTRGYVVALSEEFCKLLGEPHDKFAAEIATVACELRKPLAESVVRSWRTYNRKQLAKNRVLPSGRE